MKIVVTGSAGFVGSDLIPRLRAAGHTVLGIDLLAESHSNKSLQHDLTTPLATTLEGYDLIIHLASAVGGIIFNNNRAEIVATNQLIDRQVIDLCRRSGIKRMIYFSSINVFERALGFLHAPLTALDQATPYAISKAQSEQVFQKEFEHLMVVRPTNLFGKNQGRRHERYGESHVIPDLLHKIDSESTSLEVLGDGTQIRNFVHISDVSAFLIKNIQFRGRHYFNLRSDITVSIRELVEQLLQVRRKKLELRFNKDFMKYEVFRIVPFDMAAPKALGWENKVNSLADGL